MHTSELNFNDRSKISWVTATAFGSFHILAVIALFYTTWQAVVLALVLHWMCVSWGIGMGYHRLHTHRSYTVPKPIEYFLAGLRYANAPGRSDLLDRGPSDPSSALRQARRPAHAA